MSFEELLQQNKSAILKRWLDLAVMGYPKDAKGFLTGQKDQFANPVGHALAKGLDGLFDAVAAGTDFREVQPLLQDIIKIRAVQEFPPSIATGFVFLLKEAVFVEVAPRMQDDGVAEGLRVFDGRVDTLAGMAFDLYTGCRQQIYEMRLHEIRSRTMDVREVVARRKAKLKEKAED